MIGMRVGSGFFNLVSRKGFAYDLGVDRRSKHYHRRRHLSLGDRQGCHGPSADKPAEVARDPCLPRCYFAASAAAARSLLLGCAPGLDERRPFEVLWLISPACRSVMCIYQPVSVKVSPFATAISGSSRTAWKVTFGSKQNGNSSKNKCATSSNARQSLTEQTFPQHARTVTMPVIRGNPEVIYSGRVFRILTTRSGHGSTFQQPQQTWNSTIRSGVWPTRIRRRRSPGHWRRQRSSTSLTKEPYE
jgi:hypothetical protein